MQSMACRLCVLSIVGALLAWDAGAAGIGTVTDVVNEGYRKPPGANELPASREDELVQSEALRTGSKSSIVVKFLDGSQLVLESSSDVVLSDYVFDGTASTGLINLNVGLFHFSSADLPDSGLQLKTPVATIGIRGTEFLVTVTTEATVIDILDGAIEVAPIGVGKAATCVGGQSVLVAGANSDAICGDFGAFSTAAAPPAPPASIGRAGESKAEPKAREAPEPKSSGSGDAGGGSGGEPGCKKNG